MFAILAGMTLAPLVKRYEPFGAGIKFTSKKILQYAVVLLGFGMNLEVVMQTGKQSLPIIICTITTSLVIAYIFASGIGYSGKYIHTGRCGIFDLRRFGDCGNRSGHRCG